MKKTILIISIISLIVITILAGITFYWFQLRPEQIRKECFRIVDNSNPIKYLDDKYSLKASFDEVAFRKCLLEHGLEK